MDILPPNQTRNNAPAAGATRPAKPTPLAVNADSIPAELRTLPRWVLWCYEWRGDKWTKTPKQPSGKNAKSNDQATWSDFATVWRAYQTGKFAGVGIMPGELPDGRRLVGVDLDHMASGGNPDPLAADIVARVNSYAEFSPSGEGVRVFAFSDGALPDVVNENGHIEFYDGRGARYLTVTGHRLPGAPDTVYMRGAALAGVAVANLKARGEASKPQASGRAKPNTPASVDDQALIEKAHKAQNGQAFGALWKGDASGYRSHSEADLALCGMLAFWAGGDAARVDRLFRQSGLARDKWDEKHYENGQTYGEATIQKALASKTEFYDPTRRNGHKPGNGNGRQPAAVSGQPPEPEYIPPPEYGEYMPAEASGNGHKPAMPRLSNDAPPDYGGRPLTDMGNAERLADRFGGRLRFNRAMGWLVFDGQRWNGDAEEPAMAAAKDTARGILAEAAEIDDKTARRQTAQWSITSESASRLAAMLKLAQSEPAIFTAPDRFDANPWILNVHNGTIDLRTGKLRPHDASDLLTQLAGCEYNPAAECPTWRKFLEKVFNGQEALINFFQRAVGYSLTGDISAQAFFLLNGGGQNGKSTAVGTLSKLFGTYGQTTGFSTFAARRNDGAGPAPELTVLKGARLVTASETGQKTHLNEERIKSVTGGEAITARALFQAPITFQPAFKIWLSTNPLPKISGTDKAIWRRVLRVPFNVTITDSERDPNLPDKLAAELPGVLAWAVAGCQAWLAGGGGYRGLNPPPEVLAANAEYEALSDSLKLFLAEMCVRQLGALAPAAALLNAYNTWAGENLTALEFRARMLELGYSQKRTKTAMAWVGVGLQVAETQENAPAV